MLTLLTTICLLFSDYTVSVQALTWQLDGSLIVSRDGMEQSMVYETKESIGRQFLQDWLRPGGEPDLDGNGVVDLGDFAIIARNLK